MSLTFVTTVHLLEVDLVDNNIKVLNLNVFCNYLNKTIRTLNSEVMVIAFNLGDYSE